MTRLVADSFLPASPEAVFAHCASVEGFIQHFPYAVRWHAGPASWGHGDTLDFSYRVCGVWLRHVACVIGCEPGRGFTDEMQRGLYKRFRHTHAFLPRDGGTLVRDDIEFSFGCGRWFDETLGLLTLRKTFLGRHAALRRHFEQDPRHGNR